jgi:hypothetical protein
MSHHFLVLVQARPAGQPLPLLYGGRRWNSQHGGRLVVLKRQALTWRTRRAAERWVREEEAKANTVYGKMTFALVEEPFGEDDVPDTLEEYILVDGNDRPASPLIQSLEEATASARKRKLKVYRVTYRVSQRVLLADYRHPQSDREKT